MPSAMLEPTQSDSLTRLAILLCRSRRDGHTYTVPEGGPTAGRLRSRWSASPVVWGLTADILHASPSFLRSLVVGS